MYSFYSEDFLLSYRYMLAEVDFIVLQQLSQFFGQQHVQLTIVVLVHPS